MEKQDLTEDILLVVVEVVLEVGALEVQVELEEVRLDGLVILTTLLVMDLLLMQQLTQVVVEVVDLETLQSVEVMAAKA